MSNNNCQLPDGSGFIIASFPLLVDHWIFAPLEYERYAEDPKELPEPILNRNEHREAVKAAARYAIRASTMQGKAMDFDPDAMVLNFIYALCGPRT